MKTKLILFKIKRTIHMLHLSLPRNVIIFEIAIMQKDNTLHIILDVTDTHASMINPYYDLSDKYVNVFYNLHFKVLSSTQSILPENSLTTRKDTQSEMKTKEKHLEEKSKHFRRYALLQSRLFIIISQLQQTGIDSFPKFSSVVFFGQVDLYGTQIDHRHVECPYKQNALRTRTRRPPAYELTQTHGHIGHMNPVHSYGVRTLDTLSLLHTGGGSRLTAMRFVVADGIPLTCIVFLLKNSSKCRRIY